MSITLTSLSEARDCRQMKLIFFDIPQKCYDIVMNNTQPLKGFRDFLPSEAEARNQVFDKVRTTFEQYGFLPLETPAIEYKEVLSGKYGKEGDKLMSSFRDQGEREVALRYDLT